MSIRIFSQWFNNKVVPTLEPMQKMIQFCHSKGTDVKTLLFTSESYNVAKVIKISLEKYEKT